MSRQLGAISDELSESIRRLFLAKEEVFEGVIRERRARDPKALSELILTPALGHVLWRKTMTPLQFAVVNYARNGTKFFKLLLDAVPRDRLIYALTKPYNGGKGAYNSAGGIKSTRRDPPALNEESEYKDRFEYICARLRNEMKEEDCSAEFRTEAAAIIDEISARIAPPAAAAGAGLTL